MSDRLWPHNSPGGDSGALGLLRAGRLGALLDRDLAELCRSQGLKAGQFQVLSALRRREPQPMSATELADATVLTSGAMTPILDKLEAQGMLRRQADDGDRRMLRITITPKGRSIIDRALDLQMARQRDLNSLLNAEEREVLAAILHKLLIAIEGERSQGV